MWRHADIVNFFKLFGVNDPEVTNNLTSHSMDSMDETDLNKIGITDATVCSIIASQWRAVSPNNDPDAALKTVKQTIVST
jgi:hypothetical protein